MITIGKQAPDFRADAVANGSIQSISRSDLAGTYTVLFFYPLDFTFVCPTELHAFQERLAEFEAKNARVIGASIDSVHAHLAWLNTPKVKGGIHGVTYPLISDIHKTIARDFGVLNEEAGVALRGLFVLDKNTVVQHATINNLGFGRNVGEVLRVIDALQHHEKHGEVCPANWTTGTRALKPNSAGITDYFGQ